MNYILLAAFGLIVISVFLLALLTNKKPSGSIILTKPILTPNEQEFFYRLTHALPHYHVFPQVAFGAILKSTGYGRQASRGTFSQKIADYIICERETMKILAVVELDDRTHNPEKDAKRDKMLADVGYRTIRFNSKKKPTESEILSLFSTADTHKF